MSVAKKAKKDAIFQAELTTGSPESDRKKERKDRATKLSEAKQSLHGFVIKTRDEQLQQRAERVAPVQLEALMDAMGRNSKSVLDLFLKWDTDGNGMVSAEEFAFAVARLGFKFSKEVTDELFAFFDKDGSDAVSIDEIQAALKWGKERSRCGHPPPAGGSSRSRSIATCRYTSSSRGSSPSSEGHPRHVQVLGRGRQRQAQQG